MTIFRWINLYVDWGWFSAYREVSLDQETLVVGDGDGNLLDGEFATWRMQSLWHRVGTS